MNDWLPGRFGCWLAGLVGGLAGNWIYESGWGPW
jgi:hypothetical protein